MGTPTIVVIDDHEPFRRAFRAVAVAAHCVVVAEADSADAALAVLRDVERPDLVVVDVNLGDDSGIDLAKALVAADPALSLVLVSTMDRADLPADATDAATVGFVAKSQIGPELLRELIQASPAGESRYPRKDTT